MLLIYTIATRLYFFAIRLASIFNVKASQIIKGQKNWRQELSSKIKPDSKYILIHCASLGEFEQGRPLIEKLKKDPLTKDFKIVLSFFSPSCYEIRKNYSFADVVCYLPFDKSKNAKDFLNIINPEFAVFVKYEFWYFYLQEFKKQNIPAYSISAIFRETQIFFKPYGKFYLSALKSFKHIFVQDENSGKILLKKNITNFDICGDTRTDRVIQIAKENYQNNIFDEFSKGKNTLVCGSTWPEDEAIIAELINKSNDDYRFIIAPHELDEKHLENIEKAISCGIIRYSKIKEVLPKDVKVIIIDSICLLSKLYRYGKFSYVGGGFGTGIHNILEAVVYKIPVVFGPNYKKFKEACDLVNLGVAFSINSQFELENIIFNTLCDPKKAVEIDNLAKAYISQSSGSTQLIFDKLHYIGQF